MNSISDKAAMLRIKSAEKLEVAISMVMQTHDVSESILDALDERIKNESFSWEELIPYLIKYPRKALVFALWERRPPSQFVSAELFAMGYGGDELEDELCRNLYEAFNGKGLKVYTHIFDALSARGGSKSLEMMEIIKHEIYGELMVNEIVVDGILEDHAERAFFSVQEAEQLIHAKFLRHFSKCVEVAIENLLDKGVQLPEDHLENGFTNLKKPTARSDRVQVYMKNSREHLLRHPAASLNSMRQAAEAICKDVLDDHFKTSSNANTKPAKAFASLEDMICRIGKDDLVPSSILHSLKTLQNFGNLGSHDQEEGPEGISVNAAKATLMHLEIVFEWYVSRDSRSGKLKD